MPAAKRTTAKRTAKRATKRTTTRRPAAATEVPDVTPPTTDPADDTTTAPELPAVGAFVVIGDPAAPDPTYGIVVDELEGDDDREPAVRVVTLGAASTFTAGQVTAPDELES